MSLLKWTEPGTFSDDGNRAVYKTCLKLSTATQKSAG